MAEIILTDVTKRTRAGSEPVRGFSLTIPSGAFCVLVGASGCGKSTLLRLIANLEQVTSGQIEIGDAVHLSWRLGRPEVVELVDPGQLDPGKNLYDNMRTGLRARGLSRKEAQERVLRAADALEIGSLLARKPGQVSAGERSRAALARAFAHQPRALLFDEPLSGLDPAHRLALRQAIKRLQRESASTVIYATQHPAEALGMADLVAVMKDGRLEQAGAPAEIVGRPANRTVAAFGGDLPMNMLPVRANQTGLSLEDGTHLGGASVMTTAVYAWLGVRPEHLVALAGDDPAPSASAVFPVVVEDVEISGAGALVFGRIGSSPFPARLRERPAIGPDGRLRLVAAREHLHMFDAQTGARL
ncbi:MAG: ATP-binding cassette domain-containing protein [Hansschlegelia sp.]